VHLLLRPAIGSVKVSVHAQNYNGVGWNRQTSQGRRRTSDVGPRRHW
jgi:hypothetical protein